MEKVLYLKNPTEVPNKDSQSMKKDYNGGGGGGDMSRYVTKEEFNLAILELEHKLELNHEKTNSKLDLLSQKLDSSSNNISDKIQISLDAKDKEDKQESRETRRYILGTVILGLFGLAASIVSLFI